jgi:hypothetical protein
MFMCLGNECTCMNFALFLHGHRLRLRLLRVAVPALSPPDLARGVLLHTDDPMVELHHT